ncbi:MAG: hypothetical protein ACFB0Z_11890 [Candidatus Phaeomarinobacter sp.]
MNHLTCICLSAAVAAVGFALPAQAGETVREVMVVAPVSGHEAGQGHVHSQTQALNGQLSLGGFSGGVGNTFGSICCSGGGGFVVVTGSTRRAGGGADGDIAFRQARDAAFGQSIGGAAIDRSFRFRANRIQRSGF